MGTDASEFDCQIEFWRWCSVWVNGFLNESGIFCRFIKNVEGKGHFVESFSHNFLEFRFNRGQKRSAKVICNVWAFLPPKCIVKRLHSKRSESSKEITLFSGISLCMQNKEFRERGENLSIKIVFTHRFEGSLFIVLVPELIDKADGAEGARPALL